MKCGYVILNYNTWKMTKKLALLVSNYKRIDYVIVIDNCSPDDSFEKLKEIQTEKIVVVKSDKNGGYSYGNNFAALICKNLKIDIMIVSNPDVQIEEYDMNIILEHFYKTNYSVLTGVEYDINRDISFPPIWKLASYGDDLVNCFYFGRRYSKSKSVVDYNVDVQPIRIFKGSFFAIRLVDFLDIGGFDENVFLFCEERILSKKLLSNELKIGLVTNAKYYHNHSESINAAYKNKIDQIKMLYKSRMYYQSMYNNIGIYKTIILRVAMMVSLFEYWIKYLIH